MSNRRRACAILVIAMLAVPSTGAAAHRAQPISVAAARIVGVVRPGSQPVRLDPTSLWLLGSTASDGPRGQWTGLTEVLVPRFDPSAPWLLGNSVQHQIQTRFEGPVDWSDPRLSGQLSVVWDTQPVHSAVVELVTAEGSWSGTFDLVGLPGNDVFHIRGMLWGAGPYVGQASFLDISAAGSGTDWTVEGLIFNELLAAIG